MDFRVQKALLFGLLARIFGFRLIEYDRNQFGPLKFGSQRVMLLRETFVARTHFHLSQKLNYWGAGAGKNRVACVGRASAELAKESDGIKLTTGLGNFPDAAPRSELAIFASAICTWSVSILATALSLQSPFSQIQKFVDIPVQTRTRTYVTTHIQPSILMNSHIHL